MFRYKCNIFRELPWRYRKTAPNGAVVKKIDLVDFGIHVATVEMVAVNLYGQRSTTLADD